ncbi:Nuclear receptor sub 2 group C member 2 [Haplosporangium bisporale]|nr:Nuclear receptor sub 2 group C member 2 [Haplosporangium bisporale]
MTVAVSPDQDILYTLQQSTPHIPFDELSRLNYNTHVPGRFDIVHSGRWKEHDIEIREASGDPATIEREVRLLQKMRNCSQILHLHGYTIEPTTSTPYLVLQHNEHGSLHSYLLNFHPHLTWPDRYNLAMDIALGLRYMHQKGIRHRHLHSASVLIDTNGSAVLSDFGSSRDVDVISSREHTTRMAYLAPEKLAKTGRHTFECDIYSLGIVFWEISSGRPPFSDLITPQTIQNGTAMSLAQNIISGRRERPVEGTDPVFEDLYTHCWQANPQDRPTIDQVIQTLSVLLKQPSGALLRQLEELSIVEEEPFVPTHTPRSPKPSRSMSIKVGRSGSMDTDSVPSPSIRSRELLLSPREPDYLPPPPPIPPPIPPVSHRRKMSTAPSFGPSVRSMSISSGSSSGSSVAPIHVACFYQPDALMEVLKTLQRNGANMQLLTTLTNQSALHIVLEYATNYTLALEATKFLMTECRLSVNDQDNRGLTPFHKYIKNPNLSGIASVAGSELYTLLREKGEANLSLESQHEGNALGLAARYLRVDLMRLFLLTDLSCSEYKSLSYAVSVVEAPLSESRTSKAAQDQCRAILAEWRGERGETKRMHMAERILEHQGLSSSNSAPGSLTSSPLLSSPLAFPVKTRKQGLLGLGKSSKSKEEPAPAVTPLPSKVAAEVDVAKKLLQSTAVKQRKLKNLIADSGF